MKRGLVPAGCSASAREEGEIKGFNFNAVAENSTPAPAVPFIMGYEGISLILISKGKGYFIQICFT